MIDLSDHYDPIVKQKMQRFEVIYKPAWLMLSELFFMLGETKEVEFRGGAYVLNKDEIRAIHVKITNLYKKGQLEQLPS